MTEILRQRDIIDRRGLEAALRATLAQGHEGAEAQARLAALLRDVLQVGRTEIRQRYETDRHAPDAGRDVGHATSFLIDQLAPIDKARPIELKVYRGGHMMYLRPNSRRALAQDARGFYGSVLKGP